MPKFHCIMNRNKLDSNLTVKSKKILLSLKYLPDHEFNSGVIYENIILL